MKSSACCWLLTALLALAVVQKTLGNVLGIDFGSDSMKVAIVSPGSPLNIVTNLQSKRKTPTAVAFYKGERMFGSDATAISAKKPESTFVKLNRAIGRNVDHPIIQEYKRQFFPYEISANDTTGKTLFKQEETYYSPEELLAMMMQYAKDITAASGVKGIKDCVLTVPSSFTQHERAALYAAADIADLRVLSLIEENTAAALHYAIDRVHDEAHNVLYYNMGANSVQVSIVTYSSYPSKEGGKNKTVGQFEVIGKAWDTSLGGFSFDVKLAELMADRFNAIWAKKGGAGQDLRTFVRPMTRLRNEAVKIKEVLSANNEYPIKAEQLHANIDLVGKITRTELEEACKDLFARVTGPIQAALDMANITIDQLHAVELLGGGVRIPKVKKLLDDFFKPAKLDLGQHLNGDEAMALGASFRAANLSTAFRVRKVGMTDVNYFGVSLKLETLPSKPGFFSSLFGSGKKVEEEEAWTKQASLYPRMSPVPAKTKVVAFTYDKDILCRVEYDDDVPLPAGTHPLVAVYNITGITDFAQETEGKGLGKPKVHLSFSLDSNGMVFLNKAEATVDLPVEAELEPSPATNETSSNGSDAPKPEEPTDPAAENTEAPETAPGQENAAGEGSPDNAETPVDSDADKKEKTPEKDKSSKSKSGKKDRKSSAPKKEKETVLRRVLAILENHQLPSPTRWTAAEIAHAGSRLRALDLEDSLRRAKEAALNELEAYVYQVKNRLMDDEKELSKVSTEEQRQGVVDAANEAAEWIDMEGAKGEVSQFKAKQASLKDLAEPIFRRYSELSARPTAVSKAREQLAGVKIMVEKWTDTMPHITDEEKGKLRSEVDKVVAWLDDKETAQKGKTNFEEPAFSSSDVQPQLKMVTLQFDKLLKKPKPAPEKPKVNASEPIVLNTTTNSTEVGSDDGNSTAASTSETTADVPPSTDQKEL